MWLGWVILHLESSESILWENFIISSCENVSSLSSMTAWGNVLIVDLLSEPLINRLLILCFILSFMSPLRWYHFYEQICDLHTLQVFLYKHKSHVILMQYLMSTLFGNIFCVNNIIVIVVTNFVKLYNIMNSHIEYLETVFFLVFSRLPLLRLIFKVVRMQPFGWTSLAVYCAVKFVEKRTSVNRKHGYTDCRLLSQFSKFNTILHVYIETICLHSASLHSGLYSLK